jgi:hypothetical protein
MPETRRSTSTVGRTLIGWTLLGLMLCACQSGCVQRRMMVRSNPPGALVYVDDYEVGTTPCAVNFTYYGTRKIRLVKDGCETLTVMQSIPAPWYEYPVVDFVSENLVPGEIRDHRFLDYQLRQQAIVPNEQLIARAEQLRHGIHTATGTTSQLPGGAVRGAPPTLPPTLPPSGAPATLPPSTGVETIPTPPGVGGQPVHTLPPTGSR